MSAQQQRQWVSGGLLNALFHGVYVCVSLTVRACTSMCVWPISIAFSINHKLWFVHHIMQVPATGATATHQVWCCWHQPQPHKATPWCAVEESRCSIVNTQLHTTN